MNEKVKKTNDRLRTAVSILRKELKGKDISKDQVEHLGAAIVLVEHAIQNITRALEWKDDE